MALGPRTRRLLKTALVILLLFEVGLPLLLFLGRHRLMFFPEADPPPAGGLPWVGAGVDARAVEVARPDGRRIAALDGRPRGAGPDLPVLLFLHGNAGNAAGRAPLLGHLVRKTGVRVLLPDYSGFGGNPGSPTEAEVVADGIAAFDHLRAEGVPAERIVLYGESIGGGVAAAVAEARPCAGLVLQSTFSSVSSIALRIYPWLPLTALLTRGVFPTAERIAASRMPVLVIHGDADRVIPVEEGRALAAAAPGRAEFLLVPGAGHEDVLDPSRPAVTGALLDRLRRWTGVR